MASDGLPWVRLNAATSQDARLIRAGFWGTVAWPGILTMAKLHGWRGGRIPVDELDAALLAHHMNGSVTDETVTRGLESGIAALLRVGLLSQDGAYYTIRNWAKYQSDPSNAERQTRHREKNATEKRVTLQQGSNGCNGDGTGRTGRDSTGREEPPQPPSVEGGELGSSSFEDAPSSNGHPNGHASPNPSDAAAMYAILTAQSAYFGPASAQPLASKTACELRRKLKSGELPATEVIRWLALNEPSYRDTANEARAAYRREARAARRGVEAPTFDGPNGNGPVDAGPETR